MKETTEDGFFRPFFLHFLLNTRLLFYTADKFGRMPSSFRNFSLVLYVVDYLLNLMCFSFNLHSLMDLKIKPKDCRFHGQTL